MGQRLQMQQGRKGLKERIFIFSLFCSSNCFGGPEDKTTVSSSQYSFAFKCDKALVKSAKIGQRTKRKMIWRHKI